MVRSIGVSNQGVHHLEELLAHASTPPVVNQIEVHPFCTRTELISQCKSKSIVVQAQSPLAKAQKMDDPTLLKICAETNASRGEKGVSPAQVMIRWALQKGLVVLPKSSNKDRIKQNISVFDFSLSDTQVSELDALDEQFITGWDPTKLD